MIGALLAQAQNPATIPGTSVDWFAVAPELCLFGAAIIIVLMKSLIRHDKRVHDAALITASAI